MINLTGINSGIPLKYKNNLYFSGHKNYYRKKDNNKSDYFEKSDSDKTLLKNTANLTFLGNLGQVIISKSDKNNLEVEEIEIKELTQEEFEQKKTLLFPKIKQTEGLQKIEIEDINTYNIQIAEYILNKPKLFKNKDFVDKIRPIFHNTDTIEKAQVTLEITKHPEFFNYKNFVNELREIINDSDTENKSKSIITMIKTLDKMIKNNPTLLENKNFNDNIGYMIYYSYNSDALDSMTAMLNRISDISKKNPELWNTNSFADQVGNIITNSYTTDKMKSMNSMLYKLEYISKNEPELWNNKSFSDVIGDIVLKSDHKTKLNAKTLIIDLICNIKNNKPELWNNKNFAENIGNMLNNSPTLSGVRVARKLSEYPNLWNNDNFADNSGCIINYADNFQKSDSIINMIDKMAYIQKYQPELWNIKSFADTVGEIIVNSFTEQRYEAIESMLNEVSNIQKNKPELWNNENFTDNLGKIVYNSFSFDRVALILELLRYEDLWKNKNFTNSIGKITSNVCSPEKNKIIITIVDEIANIQKNEPELFNNESFNNKIGDIIYSSYTNEVLSARNKIINKLMEVYKNSPNLVTNQNFKNKIGDIILAAYTIEKAQSLISIINIIDDIQRNYPELWNNKDFANNIGEIIYKSASNKNLKLIILVLAKMVEISKNNPELWNNKNFSDNVGNILLSLSSSESTKVALESFRYPKLWDNEDFANKIKNVIYSTLTSDQATAICAMINNLGNAQLNNPNIFDNENIPLDKILKYISSYNSKCKLIYLSKQDLILVNKTIKNQYKKALNQPELYVNGEQTNPQNTVREFFDCNYIELLLLASIYDKSTLNTLLRTRFNNVLEYFNILNCFKVEDFDLLKKLCDAKNINNKPFSEPQKIEFIDLIKACKDNNLNMTKFVSMVNSGKVDLAQINIDLFYQIMKNSGLTEEEISSIPLKKLTSWNTKYAHLLSKEINRKVDIAFSDVLKAGNLYDFFSYIHNPENIYGISNLKTKSIYHGMNMNYEKWLKPSKENEIHFISKDNNSEKLNQIAIRITEDMNNLMNTPAKNFIMKQFPKCIIGSQFIIPGEYLTSNKKLKEFIKILSDTSEQGQLSQVWKRAKCNIESLNPIKSCIAKNTLKTLDNLNQQIKELEQISTNTTFEKIDLRIKMWDRVPQKDIFQGNYSTCCIAMGGGNGKVMPHYLLNTAYNMIELIDNRTDKIVGNALCYFVKCENGEPTFIIDNIEINNAFKPSNEICKDIRNAMADYAQNVAKEVTGKDTSVYMSVNHNDVPTFDLPLHEEIIELIGEIDCDNIYMDLYDGMTEKDYIFNAALLKLK